jgi:hypothetical protein
MPRFWNIHWRRPGRNGRLDDRGSAAIEFAFVIPIMLLLTFGVIEMGMIMATLTTMEGGLREASRYGITGQAPSDQARIDKIKAILKQHTLALVDFNEADFQVRTYESFATVGQMAQYNDLDMDGECDEDEVLDPDQNCGPLGVAGAGAGGEVVSYSVTIPWHMLTPFVGEMIAGEDGVLPLTATIVVRNEPNLFGNAGSGSGGN